EHYARGRPSDSAASLVAGLATAPASVAEAVVVGLEKGWPSGGTVRLEPEDEKKLASLLLKLPVSSRGQLVRLTERWGSQALRKNSAEVASMLLAQVRDRKLRDSERFAAAVQLIEFRRAEVGAARDVLKLVTPTTPPDLARGLLEAVSGSEASEVGKVVVALVPDLTPAVRPSAISAILSRTAWTAALVGALDRGTVRLGDVSLDQHRALAAHPDKEIASLARKVLERGGGLPNPDRQKVLDRLLSLTKKSGDATAGKLVFKAQCAKCHTHGGEGTAIGPDLTGMAVHTKEHLLTDILDPSRSVEGNFRVYLVTTKAGTVVTGLLASESRTAVELIDAEAKRQTILRADIDERVASAKSLMPEG